MSITYPHFGSLTYLFEIFLNELGRYDIVKPKNPSRKTAIIGSQHSPEFICTPFKIVLGTFMESIEAGAYELVMDGFHAHCRFGYYWPVLKMILEDLGYDFRFIILDHTNPVEFLRVLKNDVSDNLKLFQILKALRIVWNKFCCIELVDKLLSSYRAVEIDKGSSELVAEKAFKLIVEEKGIRNIKDLKKKLPGLFEKEVCKDTKVNPLKVAIIGEIYVVLEPSLNLEIHKRLNGLGVIVDTPVSLRNYVDFEGIFNPFKKSHKQIALRKAKHYLEHSCGGDAQASIGDTILYKEKDWDGMVHLYPFTCMPEIISKSILPQISKEYNMPVISLTLDEQTGEAGFQTRLEAFVDLLERKKESNCK
ncbi:MAG: CoA protein activase [Candidatus Heimdallarchaeota archaeon]|nr:MAG: CoA protein activase [Candidatus Heimdallarchaeota archaeon]